MDPRLGFHRRFLSNRQGLTERSLFPASGGGSSASTAGNQQAGSSSGSSSSDTNPLDPGGIIGGISSLLGGLTTTSTSSSSSSSTTTSTTSSSSSTSSTTTSPASSTHTSATTPTSSASASSSTASTTTTPSATSSTSDAVYTSFDGTSIVYITSTPSAASASASATVSSSPSFLHNPSLEGGVFALVGIIAVAVICSLVTWSIRKRQRDRLERDMAVAVDFDPGAADRYEQETSVDKHRLSSSSGHGYGYGVRPTYTAPQPEYYPPVGYGQYPMVAYPMPPPNQGPYQGQAGPAVPQPTAHGGANLTRKFSDRKPVPPLIPTAAYDPADTHVSIPPQFYQQEGHISRG